MSDAGRWLATAGRIAEELTRTAHRYDGRATWMGTTIDADDDAETLSFIYQTIGPSMYDGTSGIALFLAEAHARTGEPRFEATAVEAIAQALATAERIPSELRLGLFAGRIGVAYAVARVGRTLDRDDLLADAARLARASVESLDTDPLLDVVLGAAGGAVALLQLSHWLDAPDLAETSLALGRRIVAAATKGPEGWSWGERATGTEWPRNLTGFGHGAAGIGWSLLELSAHCGDGSFRDGALEAFRYEHASFVAAVDNWPDFRELDDDEPPESARCMTAWCHGAVGIGVSRLRAIELCGPDARHRADAEAAVRAATRFLREANAGRADDYCLCHGVTGAAQFLLDAAEMLGDPTADALARATATTAADLYGDTPGEWPCGLRRGSHPALMVGLAGIGYFYLGLADRTLPPVLTTLRGVAAPRAPR